MAPKAKSTRKLSPYNKFVRKYFKDNPGTTIEKAAKAWNKGKPKKQTKAKAKTRKRSYNKKVKRKMARKRNGISLLGGLGVKGLLAGIAGMALIPQFLPALPAGGAEIATGLALSTIGLGGGASLKQVGAMRLLGSQIMPLITGFKGGNGNGGNGGYDY